MMVSSRAAKLGAVLPLLLYFYFYPGVGCRSNTLSAPANSFIYNIRATATSAPNSQLPLTKYSHTLSIFLFDNTIIFR